MPAALRVARDCLSNDLTSARYGFSREFRLLDPAEFRSVFEQAERSRDSYLVVLARRNDLTVARLGLAISKKNVRKSVDRNRIKRLVRESFRHNRTALGSVDIVVMARSAILRADREVIRQSLERHWEILIKRCDSYWCRSSNSTD